MSKVVPGSPAPAAACGLFGRTRSCASVGLLLLLAASGLGGCSKTMNDVTGAINRAQAPTQLPTSEPELRKMSEDWGQRFEKNPKDKTAALTYAKVLQALNQNAQAVAVLQGLAIQHPEDKSVLATYGKALARAGQLKEAAEILPKAHTPERPDWSVLSAQGTIADELGDHEGARNYYEASLKIRPNDPTVLSNLGLSYALSRQLPRAEETLRLAVAQPGADMRVRQNLALVLALEGKFDQAEEWSRRDLAPIDAAANVAQIRQMISQSNTWRDIQTQPVAPGAAPRARKPKVANEADPG